MGLRPQRFPFADHSLRRGGLHGLDAEVMRHGLIRPDGFVLVGGGLAGHGLHRPGGQLDNVFLARRFAQRVGAKINVPNHYDMFESNSENPLLFTENIDGGRVLEFNKEYEF